MNFINIHFHIVHTAKQTKLKEVMTFEYITRLFIFFTQTNLSFDEKK